MEIRILINYYIFFWLKCKTDKSKFLQISFQSFNFQVYPIKAFLSTFVICCGLFFNFLNFSSHFF